MTTTELDDVSALLQRLLPDPGGFAERLLEQLVNRWGVPTDEHASTADRPGATHPNDPPNVVLSPRYQPESLDTLADSNVLLASALGACDCWGLQTDCMVCKGKGSSGWAQPDVELFQVFVGPAVEKLAAAEVDERDPGEPAPQENQNTRRRGVS